jgi:hypothetical protein
LIIGGLTIAEGQVVRFCDAAAKQRPAVVLAVLADLDFVLVIDGTTRDGWKASGSPVLLEVRPRTRLQMRMGLTPHCNTYFYGFDRALKLLPKSEVLVNPKRVGTCPEAELRVMQGWAFEILRRSTDGPGLAAKASLVASLSPKPDSARGPAGP